MNLMATLESERFTSSFGIASRLPHLPRALDAAAFSAQVLSSVEAASNSLQVWGSPSWGSRLSACIRAAAAPPLKTCSAAITPMLNGPSSAPEADLAPMYGVFLGS